MAHKMSKTRIPILTEHVGTKFKGQTIKTHITNQYSGPVFPSVDMIMSLSP
jgi:hypothetical protein